MAVQYPCIHQMYKGSKYEKEHPWVTYMKYQVYIKNNCINAIFTGQTGSGKSYAMLGMCQALDPDFELEGNWFFKAGNLFKAIKDYYVDKNITKKGKIWMYDEAGIDLNNLKFHNEVNKGFNAFFQTARHRNYIFACSVPYQNFVSKGVRTLMKTAFLADGWTKKNQSRVIPLAMEYNGDLDKYYRKRLLVYKNDGSSMFLSRALFPKARKKLIREYEKMKKEFTSDLFTDVCGKIDSYEVQDNQKAARESTRLSLTKIQSTVLTKLKEGKNTPQIAIEMDVSEKTIYGHARCLKNKGISIVPDKDKITGKVLSYTVTDPRTSAVM